MYFKYTHLYTQCSRNKDYIWNNTVRVWFFTYEAQVHVEIYDRVRVQMFKFNVQMRGFLFRRFSRERKNTLFRSCHRVCCPAWWTWRVWRWRATVFSPILWEDRRSSPPSTHSTWSTTVSTRFPSAYSHELRFSASSTWRWAYMPFLFFLSVWGKKKKTLFLCNHVPTPTGQPVDLAAVGLRDVDRHGGAQPGHQPADQDPGGCLRARFPRGERRHNL